MKKFEAKSGWYSSNNADKNPWRSFLPSNWKGARPLQHKVPGMHYTSVLHVSNSKNSCLLREIAKIEPRLAKSSGYMVKLVEKSGKPLSNMFPKPMSSSKCHRLDCSPCSNPYNKGNSLCGVKSVVYESVCNVCHNTYLRDPNSKHKGLYIGQTYRSLYERSVEHLTSYRREESS